MRCKGCGSEFVVDDSQFCKLCIGMRTHLKDVIDLNHSVIREGGRYRLLKGNDILLPNDETGCVSYLLSIRPTQGWVSVMPEWTDDIGKRIDEILNKDSNDADWPERLFRRRCD